MKKRNVFLVLVMAVIMLFTGCAKEEKVNPFLGKWTGSVDMTEHVTTGMSVGNSDLSEFAKFENLTFTLVFEFTEDKVALHVDEASKQQFFVNMEAGVVKMVEAMVADAATKENTTVEEIYKGMGVTRDQYVQSVVEPLHIEEMVNRMAEALELEGSYEYNDEKIVVLYEDKTYEEMKYALGLEDLTITVSDGTNAFVIPCTKIN